MHLTQLCDLQRVLLIALFVSGLFLCPAPSFSQQQDAQKLFKSVNNRFLDLKTLAYTVNRTSRMDGAELKERWSFLYQRPACFKFDYQKPHARQIILNDDDFWDYNPSIPKTKHINLAKLAPRERKEILADIALRISLNGFFLDHFQEILKNVSAITTNAEGICLIQGTNPCFSVQLDPQKKILISTEIYDKKGELILRTAASRFTEVKTGLWFPREINSTHMLKDGYVQIKVTLENIRVNEKFPAGTFKFKPTTNTIVIQN